MKDVDLGEPTSFLDHFYLGCTQRDCETSKDIVDNCGHMFESRIFVGAMENYQKLKVQGNVSQAFSLHGLMIWNVMQRNAWKDIANWRTKQLSNHTKSQRHAWMIINIKKKKMSQLENCPQFAHSLF